MVSSPIRNVVLCVDVEVILSLLQTALEGHGYVLLPAHNGQEALRVAAERRPDAVVLDDDLPDMTGGELATELKRISPDTPIVVFSAFRELPPKTAAVVDAFVQKPGGVRPLLSVLQRLVGATAHEARRFPRYSVQFSLEVSTSRVGEVAQLSGLCTDFGEGGIGGSLEGSLVPGEFVQIQIFDPRLKLNLEPSAQVRYRKGKTYGFSFCDITPRQQLEVQRLCQLLASA